MADSARYNVLYRGAVSPVGDNGKYSVIYCASDAAAQKFASDMTAYLANNTQIGISKQVRAVPSYTVPSGLTLTDVLLYRFTLVADNSGSISTVDVPLRPSANVEDVVKVITDNCTDRQGNALKFKSSRLIGQNVVTGGVVVPAAGELT